MLYALAVNSAVNAVVGLALLLAWRRDRKQAFTRWLGLSHLVQALSPPSYLAWQSGVEGWSSVGWGLLPLATAISIVLLLIGVSHLARRRSSPRQLLIGLGAFGAVALAAVAIDLRLAQSVGAVLMMLAGVLSAVWLWKLGRAERLVGVLLVLLGFNQFGWVAFGEAGLAAQASSGTILRVMLGLTLLYAAVSRSAREAGALRDRFMNLVERSHQGVAVMQGETMMYANPALLDIYGLPPGSGAPAQRAGNWRDATMAEADRTTARARHQAIMSGELPVAHWQGERAAFDGRKLHLRFSAWQVEWDGQPAEQVVVTDDTARVDAMQTLLHQATHDALTGLPNRSALLQRLRDLCDAEPPVPFALLLLDVDRFKLFNEAHGPSIGDAVLQALATALHQALSGQAEVMRLGEDEFALLAPAPDCARRADELAARVRELLAHPLALPRQQPGFFLDVSMGIALHPATAVEPEALLRAANAAMHEAKRTPGTSLQLAEERFERGSGASLDAEQALRAGMKQQEFSLVYQPKVRGRSGVLVGFEALVRWQRPGIGAVSPVEFIPAAERTGLIGPLGQLILTQACRQIAEWQRGFAQSVPVAVNVSPLQLLDPDFPDLVVRTLAEFDVPPALLTLEITESAAVTHMDQARDQLAQLRLHGISVALDDFGTGFSSLNMLRSLPLRAIKIDRSLIDPMPETDASAVVKAICDLAGVLRLDVVAEGVETEAQAEAALAAGCDVLQGNLYAVPLVPGEAAGWLRRYNSGAVVEAA